MICLSLTLDLCSSPHSHTHYTKVKLGNSTSHTFVTWAKHRSHQGSPTFLLLHTHFQTNKSVKENRCSVRFWDLR